MTDLRQLMQQSVEYDHADHVRLVSSARSRGRILRRQHRLVTAAASLAVVTIVAGGAVTAGRLLPGHPGQAQVADQGGVQRPGLSPSTAGVSTGPRQGPLPSALASRRAGSKPDLAAGIELAAAVRAVAPEGVISAVKGFDVSADEHNPAEVFGELDLSTNGDRAGSVSVNYLGDHSWGSGSAADYVNGCWDGESNCRISTLPDGSVVKVTDEADLVDTPAGPWHALAVYRLVEGKVIHVVAMAPRSLAGSHDVLSPNPPLTQDQLVQVAASLTYRS